ncbi:MULTISPECIES: prolyl-tRNA synthetase associated domain-containing protein [Roseomonadaceae]|jgi:Ala-tRNA(Pro) deacylase|uniref:Prolyl-tRNA synthetase associated domain-containing protein n=1 Tax=Roseicella frigidaeris TaxID=2230885 RepID=A0A327LYQ7_9PROT|nr:MULTISPECIES: prolyl-tRNA synthetase associated domain-containing protein [Acetobacteraceae]RAI55324.1 prolyl-tRNA synthetase associated domain-containing protein [Roseicella frigidaeris]CAH0129812.1 Prolyl-tRNA editing protein ProX [Roseomonas sp. CECT 9278]
MPVTREDLFLRLAALGIETSTLPYPEHRTVEEGKALRGDMPGSFTKNLLLKDKKGRLFLVVAHEDSVFDLKTLHARVGGQGRLGFATPEQVRGLLGVDPGAITPFGLINDTEQAVVPVIEAALLAAEWLNFHPLEQTGSTSIRPDDLLSFVRACGHAPLCVALVDG